MERTQRQLRFLDIITRPRISLFLFRRFMGRVIITRRGFSFSFLCPGGYVLDTLASWNRVPSQFIYNFDRYTYSTFLYFR